MPMPAAVASLGTDVDRLLTTVVTPKFAAYFSLTASARRSVPDPQGQPWFVYPNETMIADLTFLWSVFADIYQLAGGYNKLASFVQSDPFMVAQFHRIVEGHSASDPDGEFWHFPTGRIPLQDAVNRELGDVLRTLRDGFAHSRWFYADRSAVDYWKDLRWDTAGAPSVFDLLNRGPKNYTLYIADGFNFKPATFWSTTDLRILKTPAHILRYNLHLFLNYVLTGSKDDIFHP